MKKERLYAAYGSNLHIDQMSYRCPTAKVYGAGVLHGFRLTFRGEDAVAFANIEPYMGGEVPVLV